MKKRLVSVALATSMLMISIVNANAEFADVPNDAWCYEQVAYVNEKDIMKGVSDSYFDPDGIVTRGMLVSMLYRMDGNPVVKDAETFADVVSGAYYEQAVKWANKNKLVSGYGNGNFGPNDAITREQMALILFRFANYKSFAWSNKGDLSVYADGENVSKYARYSMGWADGFGFIKGNGDRINPTGKLTRAEAASILTRFCQEFMPDFGVPVQEEEVKEKQWHVLDVSNMSNEDMGKAIDELVRSGVYDIKITPMIEFEKQYVVRDTLKAWGDEDREGRDGVINLWYDQTTYITSYAFEECFAVGEFYGPEIVKLEYCAFLEARFMRKLYIPLIEEIRGDELWSCVRLEDITAVGW